jgi:hypothetical protein
MKGYIMFKKIILLSALTVFLASCSADFFKPPRYITKDEIESIQLSGINDMSMVLKSGEIGQICHRADDKKGYFCMILK